MIERERVLILRTCEPDMTSQYHSFDDLRDEWDRRDENPTRMEWLKDHTILPLRWWWGDNNPVQIARRMKWFWQRGRRGWADCDVWSLDSYLDGWLPDALLKLKQDAHGYPAQLADENNPEDHDSGFERWMSTLDEMIEGFKAHSRINNPGYGLELVGSRNKYPSQSAYDEVRRDWLQKVEAARKKDDALFKRGMALFTEYYGNLWD